MGGGALLAVLSQSNDHVLPPLEAIDDVFHQVAQRILRCSENYGNLDQLAIRDVEYPVRTPQQ